MSKEEKGETEKSPTPPLNAKGLFETYEKDGKRITEILRFNAVEVFFAGFIPPLVGSVSAIAIALIFHNDEISNYNWQCGRARLPSLSRIINLSVERTFWQLFLLFHVPIRVIELVTGYQFGLLHCHISEMHVIFFYIFGFCGIAHMFSNIFCHAHSLYYINPYGRLSYYLKIIFTSLYVLSAPVLVGAFILYWKKCITWAYDVFAICEYCGVFLNICFHGCAFFDIRYKVCFSVRHVEPVKNKEGEEVGKEKVNGDIELKDRAHG
ncbi:hypothetical protein NECAME_04019 [Necator americanus]|uniref:CWH43-like N-terminal domain-containing protein n=1 Tax=Necator americanus TaxID=51031 RepID=W2SYB3_NECAM|nr:hypothetical protein NECAME_04019 [Necator americanus]ETN74533.1 hypothetical protein NECAME_04019 [Necator americanus]